MHQLKVVIAGLLFSLLASLALSGCTGLVPASTPAPQTWQLEAFAFINNKADTTSTVTKKIASLKVLVEQPLTSSPLASTNIWYAQQANQLTPFSNNKWTQSLDKQLQLRLSQYLAQQPNLATSLIDAPGFLPDLRLRLSLQDWYLDAANSQLKISLQLNLINSKGDSLLSKHWQEALALKENNAASLVATSQTWLENWAAEIAELLLEVEEN